MVSPAMLKLTDLLQRSTVHGLAHAANSHNRMGQLFWATLGLGCLMAFLYNMSFTLEHFYSKPLLTSYFSNAELMDWPDVTLCNQVPVTLSSPETFTQWQLILNKASQFENSTELFIFFKLLRDTNPISRSEITPEDRILVNLTLALSTLHLGTLDEVKKNILQIAYNTGQRAISLNMQIDANIKYLSIESDHMKDVLSASTYFGRYRTPCMTFRTSQIFKQQKDAHSGLQALFFFLMNDFESYMRFNSAYFHQSTRLYLHDQDTLPTDEGILIVPGHSQQINFKTVVTHQLKQKHNCRDQQHYVLMYDASLQESRRIKLDYDLCKVLVSARIYYTRCGCYSPFLPAFKFDNSTPQLCFNMSLFDSSRLKQNALCLAEAHKKFSDETVFQSVVDKDCQHVKAGLCVRTEYNIESSDYMWPELWSENMNPARQILMQNVALNIVSRQHPAWDEKKLLAVVYNMTIHELSQLLRTDCSDAHIKARSVYSDKVVESIEFPFSQLMSDIGGQLGLYLGLSIVGLFEIVEIGQAVTVTLCRLACIRYRMRSGSAYRNSRNPPAATQPVRPLGSSSSSSGEGALVLGNGVTVAAVKDGETQAVSNSASEVVELNNPVAFANTDGDGNQTVEAHPLNSFGRIFAYIDE